MPKTSAQVAAYFRSRDDALSSATVGGIKRAGQAVAKEANRQLRANFKGRAGRAKAKFFKATGTLPDAVIVSIKPAFLEVFEEGATIKGDRYLVIPIPPFKRIGGAGWERTYRALKNRGKVGMIPQRDGFLITLDGKPAYQFQREVTLPDRLDVREAAEKEAAQITTYIDQLIDNG